MFSYGEYRAAADYISSKAGNRKPEVLMILGSGLGFLADMAEDAVYIPYGEIPGFRSSTAPGHEGVLVIGKLGGRCVMVMKGRLHYYEGYSPEEITFPVYAARLMGVKNMLLTNACGGINPELKPGDIVCIKDHIKLCAPNPLRGRNADELGPRFCDMTHTYTPGLREKAKEAAESSGIELKEGVYFYFTGPQYETPAEIRAASVLGGDVVGMSTVYEAIAGSHCGMDILGFSLVTNMAAGVTGEKLDGDEVLEAAKRASEKFAALTLACLPLFGGNDCEDSHK